MARTFHDGDRVLDLGSKNIWSKYCGKVLDAHFVLTGVGLDLIEESEQIAKLTLETPYSVEPKTLCHKNTYLHMYVRRL